ncbi:hypothetical protein THAOC_34558 [Thalassiosira oceanica]|uniref:Uncharacterized protein n=1 Tax=Thalassiosira oceanica TaxID=159749 RepID=K0R3B8_THAOC|nr:hypothetical protein THAOC_34558 [Thalassiosira oceanica]|eukprot:EJK46760.1 hypothetical protein THAOC_34558 [Thalassiosira oceanica]
MGNVRSRLMSTPESPDTPVPQPLPSSEVEGAGSGDRPAVAAVPPQSETPQPVTPSPDKVPGKQAAKSRPSRSRSSNRRSGSGSRNRAAAAVEPNERQNKRSPIRGNSEDGSRDSRAASNERQSKRSRIRGDSEDGSRDSRAASAVELEERQVKAKGSKDRSKDRHKAKRSGSRHKSQNFGHRCICSYGSCQELTRQLESVDHQFKRTLIQFNVPPSKYHDKWMPWLEALLRHLQVPEREKALYRGLEPGKKLWVAAHHFTPECVLLYFGEKTKLGVYKIRLGVKDARELLRDPLDPLDKDGKLGYMITPGYPIHEARRIIDGTRPERAPTASSE